MRKIVLTLTYVGAVFIAAAQHSVIVDLNDVAGSAPLNVSGAVLFPLSKQPEGYIMPTDLLFSRIRSFNFQNEQSSYWGYLQHKFSKSELLTYLNGIDTSALTKEVFQNKLYVLVGKDSTGSIVVIPDINDNHSFVDDERMKYKEITNKDDQIEANKHAPKIKVSYNYYNGVRIEKRTGNIAFWVYPGNLTVSSSSKDSLDKSIFLEGILDGHKEGTFSAKGVNYKVAVSPGGQGGYRQNRTRFIFARAEDEFPIQKNGYLPYKFGETGFVNGNEFRIDSINVENTKLFLTYLGNNPRAEGYMEGMYLPSMAGRSVDYRMIDIKTFHGQYLLIDFWGTWCGPCIAAMPRLKSIREKYAVKGLVILGVAYDDDLEKVKLFTKLKELNWTNVFQDRSKKDSAENEFIKKLKIDHFPTTFLIGREGKILLRDKDFDEIEKMLEKLP